MKIIFMGTPDFAVGTLEALIKAGHTIELVVTQPDKPKGRGNAMTMSPVKETALSYNLPVYQPIRIRDAECIEYMQQYSPDLIVVVAFGQILPKEILDLPKYCCVNVHASLLPKYRGAAPIQWAVINGEKVTGVTTMRMDEGLDTGDMILTEELELALDETGGSLFDRLAIVGANLCVKTAEAIEAGTATYTPQDHEQATHTRIIKKQLGLLDFTKSAKELEQLIRGLNPWPSAFTSLGNKSFKIWKAAVLTNAEAAEKLGICEAEVAKAQAASVLAAQASGILVATGDGVLELLEVQLEGKKRMDVKSFLLGYSIEAGTMLGSES